MARTPTKKPTAKAKTAVAAKAIKKPAIAAKTVAAKTKPVAAPAKMAAASKTAEACCTNTACNCDMGISPCQYGSLLRCHLFALLMQRKTLGVWVVTFAVLLSAGSLLMPLPDAMRPMLFQVGNQAITALAFALIFRLGFTGMGGLLEGAKLGTLVFLPMASLTVMLTLASIPPFMPLMGTGIIGAVLAAGAMYLLLGIAAGVLSAWYLKGCCCKK